MQATPEIRSAFLSGPTRQSQVSSVSLTIEIVFFLFFFFFFFFSFVPLYWTNICNEFSAVICGSIGESSISSIEVLVLHAIFAKHEQREGWMIAHVMNSNIHVIDYDPFSHFIQFIK
jgi:hypothetical protein